MLRQCLQQRALMRKLIQVLPYERRGLCTSHKEVLLTFKPAGKPASPNGTHPIGDPSPFHPANRYTPGGCCEGHQGLPKLLVLPSDAGF